MEVTKRKALEAAGWKIGDAAEFLGMNEEERQLLDARVQIALAVRSLRESRHLSQKDLGAKLKTSQPRVAKIERAAADVSLDQLFRAFAAVGGRFQIKFKKAKAVKGRRASTSRSTVVLEMAEAK